MTEIDVLKFGGSTFADHTDYPAIAEMLEVRLSERGHRLVIVASAMLGETERLRAQLAAVSPELREQDVQGLLPLADTAGVHLLTAALRDRGVSAAAVPGTEAGFVAAHPSRSGRIHEINPEPLRAALTAADVVVVPGGQAVNRCGRPVWLGKNSSDVSAVAAAVSTGAMDCEIFSDVAGVHTTDPRLIPDSLLLPNLSYSAAKLMAEYGAKVLHPEAITLAARHEIRIRCRVNRAPFSHGTVIGPDAADHSGVVVNTRSRVYRLPKPRDAAAARDTLLSAGFRAVVHAADLGPCLLVIGEYGDVDAVVERLGIMGAVLVGTPVVRVEGRHLHVEVCPDEQSAVRRAAVLHRTSIGLNPTAAG